MSLIRRFAASVSVGSILVAAACGSDTTNPPPVLDPVIGVSATAMTSTSVRVNFNSRAGDNTFTIERAEGATGGTFAQAGTANAPTAPGPVTYTDAGLKVNTTYRYRVSAKAGQLTSAPSSEAIVTTLPLGNASADITTDITANRTLTADTVYTLKGFIHVGNGAKLTIQPGTKIQGDYNTLASSLFIMRGAKIQAVGTADLPI